MKSPTIKTPEAGDYEQARDDGKLLRCDQCGRLGLHWFFPVICSPERLCADCA
jgi:hypothetical protein